MKRKFITLILLSVSITLIGCKKNQNKPSEPESVEESEERITEGTLRQRLNALERVKGIVGLGESKTFKALYSFKFQQYIDHNNKELGMFDQKVEIGFNGYDLPNVYVSSGYMTMSNNSLYTNNENELAFLLGCNYIFVEHRYFGNSLPVEIEYENNDTWKYLTTKQAADDAHDIVRQMKRILDGKWVSTGMSKGGMTTEMYAYYHPGDMDLYLPYVAPFCSSFNDTSVWKFIYEEAGDIQYGPTKAATMRQDVLRFQLKMLEYRNTLATKFYQDGLNNHATYSSYATKDLIYDASVMEFSFGFWQYEQNYKTLTKCLSMSESTRKQDECYKLFTSVCGADDLSINTKYAPYYIQAYQELGNYAYDYSYIREALTDQSLLKVTPEQEKDLAWKLVLPEENLKLEQKEIMRPKIENMLKTTNDNFIIIYGSSDPWYYLRPTDVTDRENISIYVNDNEPHGANIANFDFEVKEEILNKIKTILGVEDEE